jgi:glutaconate CoA-transferase subunit B
MEMLAVAGARSIDDGDTVFIGFGLPMISSILAKNTHAPSCTLLTECGIYGPRPTELPMAVADARWFQGIPCMIDSARVMNMMLQNKKIEKSFLGGAQVDLYGNINSTAIGDYLHPKSRLPGSGGASDIAALAHATIISIVHEPRRMVKTVDYLTSPGWVCKDFKTNKMVRREELGMWGGPKRVISNLAIMEFDDATKEMYVAYYYKELGVTLDKIIENTSFDIDVSRARPFEMPTDHELNLLRNTIDPEGIYLTD